MQLLYETGSISWSNKCMQANWKTTSQLKRRCHYVTTMGLLFQAPIPLYSTSWVGGKEGGGGGRGFIIFQNPLKAEDVSMHR